MSDLPTCVQSLAAAIHSMNPLQLRSFANQLDKYALKLPPSPRRDICLSMAAQLLLLAGYERPDR